MHAINIFNQAKFASTAKLCSNLKKIGGASENSKTNRGPY
jgi:hypothetical protein